MRTVCAVDEKRLRSKTHGTEIAPRRRCNGCIRTMSTRAVSILSEEEYILLPGSGFLKRYVVQWKILGEVSKEVGIRDSLQAERFIGVDTLAYSGFYMSEKQATDGAGGGNRSGP